jgi:GTP-binding protein
MYELKKAQFVGSFVREDACPKSDLPEYAFIGRSNVGKSSLINMLCRQKDLAKASQTPGKTQTINYFEIDGAWHIVDLPGYGYARTSKVNRAAWEKMIHYFLKNRQQLECSFLLIDAMIPPQQIDIDFMNWLGENRVPFVIAYTKTDRILPIDLKRNLALIRAAILEHWETLPQEFITSAEKRRGREEILGYINDNNQALIATEKLRD